MIYQNLMIMQFVIVEVCGNLELFNMCLYHFWLDVMLYANGEYLVE